jgi:16S rRNA (uracil1498-N3)-methyltransferase
LRLRREAKAHVFVSSLDSLALSADDVHHLGRVLRLRAGESVTASDGAGSWRPCLWSSASGDTGALEATGEVVSEDRPSPALTVAFAPTKGDRPEWVVQKLAELGVDAIVPLQTDRSVVKWSGDRAGRQVERLRVVAREAAMQSRRVWLPVVHLVTTLASLDDVALAEFDGDSPVLSRPVLAIGPEGGWSEAELGAGRPTVDLGPTVLRSETAAVTAGAILCALRAGLVHPT